MVVVVIVVVVFVRVVVVVAVAEVEVTVVVVVVVIVVELTQLSHMCGQSSFTCAPRTASLHLPLNPAGNAVGQLSGSSFPLHSNAMQATVPATPQVPSNPLQASSSYIWL